MALLVDKYRPKDLDSMELHASSNNLLKRLISSGDFPHLLLYGPSGAGKKTRALAVLRELYGPGAEKVRVESRSLKSGSTNIDVTVITSSYHLELTPHDLGTKDSLVVQQLIKESAQSPPPITTGRNFKVVLINDADCLSRQAQAALRRTMEKYIGVCRLILVAESLSKLIPPVKSRCLCVRISAPTEIEISTVLNNVMRNENVRQPMNIAEIAAQCNRDLRRALLMLETYRLSNNISKPNWESYCLEISKDIISEQSPKQLLNVRNKLYDLLCACIPAEDIFKNILNGLIQKPGNSKVYDLISLAAKFEHSMRLGTKDIIHLEAFCAKAMATIRA